MLYLWKISEQNIQRLVRGTNLMSVLLKNLQCLLVHVGSLIRDAKQIYKQLNQNSGPNLKTRKNSGAKLHVYLHLISYINSYYFPHCPMIYNSINTVLSYHLFNYQIYQFYSNHMVNLLVLLKFRILFRMLYVLRKISQGDWE